MECSLRATDNETKNLSNIQKRAINEKNTKQDNKCISIKGLKDYIKFFDVNGRASCAYARMIRCLRMDGYNYISELEGKDVGKFVKTPNIGIDCIATLIVVCRELEIKVMYDKELYGEAIKVWEKRFVYQ